VCTALVSAAAGLTVPRFGQAPASRDGIGRKDLVEVQAAAVGAAYLHFALTYAHEKLALPATIPTLVLIDRHG